MTHIEIWLVALALAMDCFAVSMASGIIFKRAVPRQMVAMVLLFGLFQALNPLLGWLGAELFRELIESVDHWIAFAILGFLGVRMIIDSFKDEEEKRFNPRRFKVILTLAVATSIDALAVGISFSCMGYSSLPSLIYPLVAIGIVSSAMTALGLFLGVRFGKAFAGRLRAELWGGIILIAIGVKVLIEHLSV
ncbi:MAG: manganese efflux pump [Bacteroidales bacterium]|nr:manganese efflux pump [Bacteroidales bacterium]